MKSITCFLFLTFATLTRIATACPMCKDSVSATKDTLTATPGGGGGGGSVGAGFNYSIYLFLGAFFCTLGLVSFNLVRGVRSSRPLPTPQK